MTRVVALVNCYNEEDIICATILDLIDQGVKVHVLDDGSSDSSWAILEGLTKRYGPESLVIGHTEASKIQPKRFNLEALMKEKAQIAHDIYQGWWVMHVDADEMRRSPWKDLTLAEALEVVKSEGYNAVDHMTITCGPVEEFDMCGKLLDTFDKCKPPDTDDRLNVWIQGDKMVDLGCGHKVAFEGMRVWPKRFLLLHFQLRTYKQAYRKILKDRLPLFSESERRKGWHVHYNHMTTEEAIRKHFDTQDWKSYKGDKLFDAYVEASGVKAEARGGGMHEMKRDPLDFLFGEV